MNTQQAIKISIPNLCHEDWNKMTPNEKGSFCSKCSKTVVDFTKKSPDEIKNILLEASGKKVCGRFMSDQLDETPKLSVSFHVPFFAIPKQVSFNRSFAIALFVVFGTTLFSCTTHEGETVGEIRIDSVENNVTNEKIIDTASHSTGNIIKTDTIPHITNRVVMGGMIKPIPHCQPLKGDVAVEHIMLGEVMAVPDSVKTTLTTDTADVVPKMGKIKVYRGHDQ